MSKTSFFALALLSVLCSCRGMTDDVHYAASDNGPVITLSNPYPAIGEKITVTVSNAPEGAKVSVDFGDGSQGSGVVTSHSFENAGNFKITAHINANGTESTVSAIAKAEILALSRALRNKFDGTDNSVWVMSHRANTEDLSIPENSISAINACIAAGADMVETDTYVTSDGVVVICHDATINRTTTGSGTIGEMNLATIKSYFLLDRNGRQTSEIMPTLKEFLDACRGKIYVDLDYSPRAATSAQVYSVVRECGMLEQVIFSCDDAEKVSEILTLDPTAHVYCSTAAGAEVIAQDRPWVARTGKDYTADALLAAKHKKGVPSCTIMDSTTGDIIESTLAAGDDAKISQIISNGMQMMMTDYTDTVLGYLRSHGYHD